MQGAEEKSFLRIVICPVSFCLRIFDINDTGLVSVCQKYRRPAPVQLPKESSGDKELSYF